MTCKDPKAPIIVQFRYRTVCLAEFIGTLILVLAGAGAVASTSLSELSFSLPIVALVFGATVAVLGMANGELSSAHIDPAVSVSQSIGGKFRRGVLVSRVISQVLGGIFAGFILKLVFPASTASRFLGSTLLASSIPAWAGTILEALGTFALCIVVLFTSALQTKPKRRSVIVGFSLFVLILILGPYTSASLNPARSIGPALASGHLDNLGVYIVGPLSGGSLAGFIRRMWAR